MKLSFFFENTIAGGALFISKKTDRDDDMLGTCAFVVKMREDLAANAAILKRLAEIGKTLLLHDTALRDISQKLLEN